MAEQGMQVAAAGRPKKWRSGNRRGTVFRRPWSGLVIGLGLLPLKTITGIAGLGVAAAIAISAIGDGSGLSARAAQADAAALLDARSPGEREAGILLASKPAREPKSMIMSMAQERENGVPALVERALGRLGPSASADVPDLIPLPDLLLDGSPVQALASALGLPRSGAPVPSFAGGLPLPGGGGSGGGGGGGPGSETPEPNPPVVSPVPEPSSWIIMIAGFVLVGWVLRRGRAAGRQPGLAGAP
jgi:hypothetical protein